MRFDRPLLPGRLVRRYQRFLADVILDDGRPVKAHTPNTGSMLGCQTPGSRVWLSESDNPARKLKYTWEIASEGDVLVGVHTGRTNALAEGAITAGRLPALAGWDRVRREVKVSDGSRLDLLLERDGAEGAEGAIACCFVEVKNVTLAVDGAACFPDAVSERGTRHLGELRRLVAEGNRAAMVYVVQRMDCDRVRPAPHIDATYAAALREAVEAGVEAYGLRFRVTPEGIDLDRVLPVEP